LLPAQLTRGCRDSSNTSSSGSTNTTKHAMQPYACPAFAAASSVSYSRA
jgi:hypothetical protein